MPQTPAAPRETPWSSVVLSFGRFVVAATGIPGGTEALNCAVDLIRAIEGAQEAQTEMLNATRFLDAEPMCSSPEESALNELYLGLTLGLLNSREDASYWLRASALSGTGAARILAESAGNIKVLKTKKPAALAAVYYPPGAVVLIKKRRKKQEAQAAADALADFLPFVNTAVSCHNAPGLETPLPALELTPMGKNKWTLEEVALPQV